MTSFVDLMGHIPQELFQEIFIPVDNIESNFLGILLQGVKSFLVFLIRMDVGVEEVSGDFLPFSPHLLKRIDCAVGTTDMQKNFHLLETVSSNAESPAKAGSNEC